MPEAELSRGRLASKKVFIVHGRETKPLKELKAMLVEVGLHPVILHEKPSGSRTIVEKLEKHSDVGYAFVILTPNDIGCLKKPHDELSNVVDLLKPRARQNVVLEFGYFMGLLGRDRVCCLYKGNVELPSDMHGIVYVPFKKSVEECRKRIFNELKEAGYEIKAPYAGYCDKCGNWSDNLEQVYVTWSDGLEQVEFLCEECNIARQVEALIESTSKIPRDVNAKNALKDAEKLFVRNQERIQSALRKNMKDLEVLRSGIERHIGSKKAKRFYQLLERVSIVSDTMQYSQYVKDLLRFLHEQDIIHITLPFVLNAIFR